LRQNQFARLALQQLQTPRRGGFAAWFGETDDGYGPDEQQLPQPFIAGLADLAQASLARR
jgi:hypothetical protein